MSTLEVNTITPQSGTTLTLGGSGDTIQVASGVTNNLGITEADQWRLTTSFTGDASPIASNLERVDTSGQGYLGTGMTQSSGIFTFPSTGYWLVTYQITFYAAADTNRVIGRLWATTDNSTYNEVANAITHANTSGNDTTSTSFCTSIIDVTDTSQVKVRFDVDQINAGNEVNGNSGKNLTSFTFIRLGDT